MSAYDHFLKYSSKSKINDYHQALVSNKRGTLSNGNFSLAMNLRLSKDDQENLFEDQIDEKEGTKARPIKIYQRVGKTQYPGIIFNQAGTEQTINYIANNGFLRLYEDFSDKIAFSKASESTAWTELAEVKKRKCLSRNIEEMIKKTDVNYRTHGDRMHYLVVGLLNTLDLKGESNNYPLFLFACTNLNKNELKAEVEQEGFINFWLDKHILEGNLLKLNGTFSIGIDGNFASKINMISNKLSKLQLNQLEKISVDLDYSALSIVTGFEPEYIDPAWEKILGI